MIERVAGRQAQTGLSGLVDGGTAHYRANDRDILDFVYVDRVWIVGQEDEAGQLARRDGPLDRFFMGVVGGIEGVAEPDSPIKPLDSRNRIEVAIAAEEWQVMLAAEGGNPEVVGRNRLA